MRTETSQGKKLGYESGTAGRAAFVMNDEMKRSLNRWRFDDAFAVIGEYLGFSRIGGSTGIAAIRSRVPFAAITSSFE
jgi:hypothetical protein